MADANGLEKFKRRLAAIPKAVQDAAVAALQKDADELVSAMKGLATVKTGALRDSIVATPPGGTTPSYSQPGGSRVAGPTEFIVTAGNTNVRYAHLVEYGSVHGHAQPFFWPAYRLLKKRMRSRVKRAISKAAKDQFNG